MAPGPGGPIAPGESASFTFDLDPSAGAAYLSYTSMVIPSNDAFVANGDPMVLPIFDVFGTFVGGSTVDLAPAAGHFLTPVWVGFHDGGFDVFTEGEAASEGLERLAEDGNAGPLSDDFAASESGDTDGVVPGPGGPIVPGETASASFLVDGHAARYLSFASMVIPSNDAFVGNDDATAIPVFDGQGRFVEGEDLVVGERVLDAGTEANSCPWAPAASSTTRCSRPLPRQRHLRLRQRVGPGAGQEPHRRGATFTFFGDENVELVLKVLDACTFNGRFWVFSSGLTDVEVEILVEDLESGTSRTYRSDGGSAFEPILDTDAFATCK